MTALPASLIRGLSLVAIGAALTLSHITFAAAAAKPAQAARATGLAGVADVETTGSAPSGPVLAENCYVEVVREMTAMGKILTHHVHECD